MLVSDVVSNANCLPASRESPNDITSAARIVRLRPAGAGGRAAKYSERRGSNDLMSWTVLVTARAFWVSGEKAQARLDAAGCRTVRSPEAGPVPEEPLIGLLRDCDAVVASSDPYTARLFGACPRLKIVSRCGVGIDTIDLDAAARAGVVVTNTPGAMTEAVGDYTWALILGVSRRIAEGDALMRSGGWGEYPGVLVTGKTLGLVGFGQIGQAVARRAKGFSMKVLAFDPIVERGGPPADLREVQLVSLDRLLADIDFV